MSKGIATVEQYQCPICTKVFDSGSVLVQKFIGTPRLNPHTVTDFELCPACAKLDADGFIALVELKGEPTSSIAKLRDTWPLRTGERAHLRRSVWAEIFNMPVPPHPFLFVQEGVLDMLKRMQAQ